MKRHFLPTIFIFLSMLTAAVRADDSVRLYVFDCGNLRTSDISMFGISNEETPVRELFVPCYLIEHPQGRMIWDAGLPPAMAQKGEFEAQPGVFVRYDTPLVDQLAALDLAALDGEALVAACKIIHDREG